MSYREGGKVKKRALAKITTLPRRWSRRSAPFFGEPSGPGKPEFDASSSPTPIQEQALWLLNANIPCGSPVLDPTLDGQETTVPKVFDILPICHAKGFDHQGQEQDWEILGQDDANSWQGMISAFLRNTVKNGMHPTGTRYRS